MPFKISYSFVMSDARLGGWTENFWHTSADRTPAEAAAAALLPILDGVHGNPAFIQSYRVARVDAPVRDVSVFRTGEQPGSIASVIGQADYPTTAVLLLLKAANGQFTRQWIKAIFDSDVRDGGLFKPVASHVARYGALTSFLTNPSNGMGVRVLNSAILPKVITALNLATGVVTVPAHGMGAPGDVVRVRISRFTQPKSVNKVWRAVVLTADTLQLSFFEPISDLTATGINPTARLQVYTTLAIATAAYVYATSHRIGRPTGLHGGRRRTVRT